MAKFLLKAPMFYEGRYIDASPSFPVVHEIHDKYKPKDDPHGNWEEYHGQEVVGEELQPHFVPPGHYEPNANQGGALSEGGPQAVPEKAAPYNKFADAKYSDDKGDVKAFKGKRPSDKDV